MTIHMANRKQLNAVLRILGTLNPDKAVVCEQVDEDLFEITIKALSPQEKYQQRRWKENLNGK